MRVDVINKCAIMVCIALATIVSAPAEAGDTCHLEMAAKLPMTILQSGRISVPMMVSGKTLNMLVDTGGIMSMLSPESVANLGLTLRNLPTGAEIYQYGGLKIDHSVEAQDIALGRLKAESLKFLVMPRGGYLPDEDGVLAPEILSRYDVEFDFANASLNLLRPNDCGRDPVYWTQDPIGEVEISHDAAWHITLPVTLDGHRLKAFLDTGASGTLAKLERIEDKFGFDDKNSNLKMIGTADRPRYRYPFKSLSFQDVAVNNPDIVLVPDVQSKEYGEPDIILGMNVLRELHLYIAYKQQKIYVTPASAH